MKKEKEMVSRVYLLSVQDRIIELETKLKQLHIASERMRSDLLIRGEIADNGTRIVNVSASVWEVFCDAIDNANLK